MPFWYSFLYCKPVWEPIFTLSIKLFKRREHSSVSSRPFRNIECLPRPYIVISVYGVGKASVLSGVGVGDSDGVGVASGVGVGSGVKTGH